MSLCDSCMYHYYVEQLKPCIIRRDDCEFYEKEESKAEIKFDEEQEQLDFVQPRKSIPVTLTAIGHWIYEKHFGQDYCICSKCSNGIHMQTNRTYNYCPICGVKIVESQESEE